MSYNNLDGTTARYERSLRSGDVPPDERRHYARYRCAGSVQLRTQGDTMRTWGTFTDISRRGCYVEVQATFPPGTKMYLLLELHEYRVHTKAVVGSRTRS
ncbi:MAG TPA: PilZ domain-containing protein [Terriglobales bacterium]|nr:PilZ domain-containing protein [Terriglobales bacterium]